MASGGDGFTTSVGIERLTQFRELCEWTKVFSRIGVPRGRWKQNFVLCRSPSYLSLQQSWISWSLCNKEMFVRQIKGGGADQAKGTTQTNLKKTSYTRAQTIPEKSSPPHPSPCHGQVQCCLPLDSRMCVPEPGTGLILLPLPSRDFSETVLTKSP